MWKASGDVVHRQRVVAEYSPCLAGVDPICQKYIGLVMAAIDSESWTRGELSLKSLTFFPLLYEIRK